MIGLLFFIKSFSPSLSPNALHWFEKGEAALHEGTYLTATSDLEAAIKEDNSFALAHARLAEAWSELDFKGKAEHELLIASDPGLVSRLRGLDREYFEAIRAYVTEDYQGAVREFQRILSRLPQSEKANGYLDLGRALERSGNLSEALKNYSRAARLPPESPAPFLRLAILESRANKSEAAGKDFTKAESLYRTAGNYEGIAEVNYQRGYVASTRGQLPEARTLIQKSLQAADEMSSVQLRVRAVTRLAVIAYGQGNSDEAIRLANEAIATAHDKSLNYWAIDARVRLANVFKDSGDLDKADSQLQQALNLAREGNHPRLIALASWSLAGLRNRQEKPDDIISLAQSALHYYRKEGFANESLSCLMLISRAKLSKSQFQDALHDGLEALTVAQLAKNPAAIYPVEEIVGSVKLQLEQYPDALSHFQAALAASRAAGMDVEYQLLHCADAFWRLGRYKEARQMIASVPSASRKQADIANLVDQIFANIELSRGNYPSAVSRANLAAQEAKTLPPTYTVEAQLVMAQAYAQLGSEKAALRICQRATETAQKVNNPDTTARINSTAALVFMKTGALADAKSSAESALSFVSTVGQKESPEAIAEDRNMLAALSLGWRERPAEQRGYSEHGKHVAFDFGRLDSLRLGTPDQSDQCCFRPRHRGDVFENMVLLAPIADSGIARPIPLKIFRGYGFPDHAQARRLAIGQRPQQDPSMTLNIAVFAPMPSAMSVIARNVNPGLLRRVRKA